MPTHDWPRNGELRRRERSRSLAPKRAYLAWRGYANAQGVLVDDFGAPTNIQGNEGDIRPAPVLLRL